MSNHPYPKHVIKAVAVEIENGIQRYLGSILYTDAHELEDEELAEISGDVLEAVWYADDPHKLSADEAREIWRLIVQVRGGDTESMHDLRRILAAHAPDWGNQ